MATKTITVPIPSLHWFTYPILIGSLLFVLWLWHSTKVNDASSKQAVANATSAQVTVDKAVTAADKTAQANLQAKNAQLARELAAAKTVKQQAQLVDQDAGTSIAEAQPQAEIPSSPNPQTPPPTPQYTISAEDIQKLAALAVGKEQAENQVAADKLELEGKDQQIEVRDTTIAAQTTEIKTLKGGSHFKRFLNAAKYVVIGGAIGAGIGYASHH